MPICLDLYLNFQVNGRGLGVLEAPRGILVHSCLTGKGTLEKLRLLVATQFNNAYINLNGIFLDNWRCFNYLSLALN